MENVSKNVREKLAEITTGKVLIETTNPDFIRTNWETRSNGAMVCVVYSWAPETGPIATPAMWMPHFEGTPEDRIDRSIHIIQEQIQAKKEDICKLEELQNI